MWQNIFNGIDGDMVVLDKVFRQKDSKFLTILNDMRRGVVTQASAQLLENKVAEYQHLHGMKEVKEVKENPTAKHPTILKTKYTKLFSTNRDVDLVNEQEFNKLVDPITYTAEDGHIDEGAYNTLKSGTKATETLRLAVGAQVHKTDYV